MERERERKKERKEKRRSWNQRPFQGQRRGCQSGKRPLTNSSLINGFQSAKNWQCIANDWQTDPLVLSIYFRPILSISLWLPAILESPLFDGRVASNDGRCLRHVIFSTTTPSLFSSFFFFFFLPYPLFRMILRNAEFGIFYPNQKFPLNQMTTRKTRFSYIYFLPKKLQFNSKLFFRW